MVYEKEKFIAEYQKMVEAADLDCFSDSTIGERLHIIAENLDTYGSRFNLTAITESQEVLAKHFIDSLFAAKEANTILQASHSPGNRLLDVGSGAGFPSLPIAAALPDLSVTALDSTAKKITYIKDTAGKCGLASFDAICTRAEEAGQKEMREQFDIVTARAVARLPVLMELCTPFLRVGGHFIAMKGSAAQEEVEEARRAASLLSCELVRITPYFLPGLEDQRFLLIYRKNSPTSSTYPRNAARIAKKPL